MKWKTQENETQAQFGFVSQEAEKRVHRMLNVLRGLAQGAFHLLEPIRFREWLLGAGPVQRLQGGEFPGGTGFLFCCNPLRIEKIIIASQKISSKPPMFFLQNR